MIVHREGLDMLQQGKVSEWEVTAVTSERVLLPCDGASEVKHVTLNFTLEMKRNSVFHVCVVLFPAGLLSVSVVFIFFIPPERPDRTGLGKSRGLRRSSSSRSCSSSSSSCSSSSSNRSRSSSSSSR